jgi:hypothetical protein
VWPSRLRLIRRSISAAKAAALFVLLEQAYEVAVLGISLAEHPVIVIAALGALGFPVPKDEA